MPCWQGAHAIPRVITLEGGRLIQRPIPELQVLRGRRHLLDNLTVTLTAGNPLRGVRASALEIIATFLPGDARRFGLRVRTAANAETGVPV